MSDVTESLTQDAIADSLMDPAGVTPLPQGFGWSTMREVETPTEESGFDPNLSQEENEVGDSLVDEPESREAVASPEELDQTLGNQAWRQQAEQNQREQQPQEQPQELTPAQVHEGVERLGQEVERLGLDDPSAATQLAYELMTPFGGDPGSVDAKALGATMSKAVLSAAQIHESAGGNLQNLPPISPETAKVFTSHFLRAFGVDARTVPVDSNRLASTVLAGTFNFISAVKTYGLNASLEQLNSPEAAEVYVNSLLQAFGQNQPVSREHALRLADTFGKYVLGILGKIPQPEQARPSPRQSSRPGRKSNHSRPQFRTNRDIFSDDVLDRYHQQHGRL
jgi:hypothetical protein